jgi:hypothetical protein
LSTDALVGGGLLRSSEEVAVMAMERREQLIKLFSVSKTVLHFVKSFLKNVF